MRRRTRDPQLGQEVRPSRPLPPSPPSRTAKRFSGSTLPPVPAVSRGALASPGRRGRKMGSSRALLDLRPRVLPFTVTPSVREPAGRREVAVQDLVEHREVRRQHEVPVLRPAPVTLGRPDGVEPVSDEPVIPERPTAEFAVRVGSGALTTFGRTWHMTWPKTLAECAGSGGRQGRRKHPRPRRTA